ncbi:MAG: biopolymer transporter ExbD [Pseudomonadota bacterium]
MSASLTMANRLGPKTRRRLKISLTPLIDVVFILLVFFMLASSFLDWRSIQVSSAGQPGSASGVQGSLLVDLSPQGVRLSGETMALEDLSAKVAARIQAKPDQRILIRPATGVDMQRMVTLLDRLAEAGARDIALMPGR